MTIKHRRIGIVMPLATQSGGAEALLAILLAQNATEPLADYSLLFLQQGHMVSEARSLGYRVHVHDAGRLRNPFAVLLTLRAVYNWLEAENIHCVMSWMSKAHLYAGLAAKLKGVTSVWWQHGLPSGGWLDRLATLIPAQCIFACSEAAAMLQRQLLRSPAVQVIYPAIDIERFRPRNLIEIAQLRIQHGLSPTTPVVAIAARFQRWKGIHLLIEAASLLRDDFPQLRILIVGGAHWAEPDYEDQLKLQASELGLADRIEFVGYQKEPEKWLCMCDVLVNASAKEPFGMGLVEGMALGKAVVAAHAGGPSEIVASEENGLLIAPMNAAMLASALSRLFSSAELRNRLGEAAIRRSAEFSPSAFSSKVASALQAIAD